MSEVPVSLNLCSYTPLTRTCRQPSSNHAHDEQCNNFAFKNQVGVHATPCVTCNVAQAHKVRELERLRQSRGKSGGAGASQRITSVFQAAPPQTPGAQREGVGAANTGVAGRAPPNPGPGPGPDPANMGINIGGVLSPQGFGPLISQYGFGHGFASMGQIGHVQSAQPQNQATIDFKQPSQPQQLDAQPRPPSPPQQHSQPQQPAAPVEQIFLPQQPARSPMVPPSPSGTSQCYRCSRCSHRVLTHSPPRTALAHSPLTLPSHTALSHCPLTLLSLTALTPPSHTPLTHSPRLTHFPRTVLTHTALSHTHLSQCPHTLPSSHCPRTLPSHTALTHSPRLTHFPRAVLSHTALSHCSHLTVSSHTPLLALPSRTALSHCPLTLPSLTMYVPCL